MIKLDIEFPFDECILEKTTSTCNKIDVNDLPKLNEHTKEALLNCLFSLHLSKNKDAHYVLAYKTSDWGSFLTSPFEGNKTKIYYGLSKKGKIKNKYFTEEDVGERIYINDKEGKYRLWPQKN